MRLEIEKVTETKSWSNTDFNAKFLSLVLTGTVQPVEIRIFFSDRAQVLAQGMFSGLPYLQYKRDAKLPAHVFKRMPVIEIDRRYAYYFVQVTEPGSVASADTTHNIA